MMQAGPFVTAQQIKINRYIAIHGQIILGVDKYLFDVSQLKLEKNSLAFTA